MDRKDFLKSTFAMCGLAAIPTGILQSCSKQSYAAPSNVNFTIDLSQASNAALNSVGGYILSNGLIITRYNATTFTALSATCTHNGCTVYYNPTSMAITCPCHGGTFDANTGNVLGGPPPSGLTKYSVSKSGTILTIKS